MKFDRQQVGVSLEVAVVGENRHGKARGNGTNQKVGVGTLKAPRAASIVKESSFFIIRLMNRQIREGSQPFSDGLKLNGFPDPGKEFLANRPNQKRAFFPYQRG